jgi:hypothetical protein
MDLDEDKVTNNMDEAARQAALMPQPAAPAPAVGGAPGVPGVADMTGGGGGNIGIGAAAMPGEQGFSAAPQPTPVGVA